MRIRTAESKYTLSVNIPTSLYHKLVDKAGRGKIGTFIREVLEEKLITEEQNQKEQLKKRLIEAYKREAENKEVQEEMAI
ncbi:MAG TPA: hypothetical protein VKR58_07325 [Aquella sp.]|nr:hypothetical protein [Aquella sp.]